MTTPLPSSRQRLIGGLAALAASPIPATLQFHFGGDGEFWAGAPLFLLGLGLIVSSRLPALRFPARPETSGPLSSVTFHELSAGASILAILGVYGFFTAQLWGIGPFPPVAVGALIGSTVLMIAVMTASHILLVLVRRPEPEDERDRQVNLRSNRNGYAVLCVGVWGVLFLALAQTAPTYLAYAAMGAFVLAELVRLASQLVYYRTLL